MTDRKRVFCKNCKYIERQYYMSWDGSHKEKAAECGKEGKARETFNPIEGHTLDTRKELCLIKNNDMDCQDYKESEPVERLLKNTKNS